MPLQPLDGRPAVVSLGASRGAPQHQAILAANLAEAAREVPSRP